jgi:hypothetical protein
MLGRVREDFIGFDQVWHLMIDRVCAGDKGAENITAETYLRTVLLPEMGLPAERYDVEKAVNAHGWYVKRRATSA